MDKARQILVATCSSLTRLQLRMLNKQWSADYSGEVVVRYPHWTVADVDPPSAWLAESDQNMALSGAIKRITLIVAHLLAMVEAPGDIDGFRACVVLQSLSNFAWSPWVIRLAKHLDVELPETPLQASNGADLSERDLP